MSSRRVLAGSARRAGRAALVAGSFATLYCTGLTWLLVDKAHFPAAIALAIALGGALPMVVLGATLLARLEHGRRRARGRRLLESLARAPAPERAPVPAPPAAPPGAAAGFAREMRESREIQRALLPARLPTVAGYHLEVAYRPCGVLGGDFYDLLPMADGRLWLTLGDVSGKGPSGAIVMAMVQTLFRQLAPIASGPADLLRRVNDGFSGALGKGVFVTATAAVLDPARHRLVLAGAGHPPALLLEPENKASRAVAVPGLALGLVAGERFGAALQEVPLDLEPGAALLLYTDGATEIAADLVRDVGESRLRAAAAAAILGGAEGALARLGEDLFAEAPGRDDTTLLMVARAPRAGFTRRSDRKPAGAASNRRAGERNDVAGRSGIWTST